MSEQTEYFKVVVSREIDFPDAPHGSHPHWCASDCSYCGSLESYESACEELIEEVVEELSEEFEADVEHQSDKETGKQKVTYWLKTLLEDTKKAVSLSKERGTQHISHYGQAVAGVPLDHAESVIKAIEEAQSMARLGFDRAGE